MEMQSKIEHVKFRQDLFREGDDGGALIGSKCKSCKRVFFPPNQLCVSCLSQEIESVELSREGTLYTYTIVYIASELFKPPFAVGWVQLAEGVKVFSQLRGWESVPLKMGMKMGLAIEKLWEKDGRDVIGYVFKPV